MFRAILDLLAAPKTRDLTAQDADLALAALLVRLARADNRYDTSERIRIERILVRRQGLTSEDAAALRKEAEAAEAEAPDTVRFTRTLKDRIAYEDRSGVIEALWEVALSDEERSPEEDALIRLVANLLGISDRDSAFARQRVEKITR